MQFKKQQIIPLLLFAATLGAIFYRWFLLGPIIGGDWPFLYTETLKEFSFFVPSWNTWQGNGLGGINQTYFLQIFHNATVFFVNFFHIPWVLVYKVFWFGLFIALSVLSSMYWSKTVLAGRKIWIQFAAALIFTVNTYSLMLADGGQMGVLLSYGITPLVFAVFINNITAYGNNRIQKSLLAALVLSIQVMFDPRIAYLTMIGIVGYFVYTVLLQIPTLRKVLPTIIYTFVIPSSLTVCLHAIWIIPYVVGKQNFTSDFGAAYSSLQIVKFLSFASFSQTVSLLHPNWPDNIFGKVYFMRPEFLFVPIIAFGSFLFVRSEKQKQTAKNIVYFLLLGCASAFLAKGANDPFGGGYLAAFSHVPGFVLFRDATKFYLLTILSFAVVIPYTLERISEIKIRLVDIAILNSSLLFVLFTCCWLFLVRPAVLGQLHGTFKQHDVPQEYVMLKDFLYTQPEFFRTLWVPRQQRFTFYSNSHPSVEAMPLFRATSSADVVTALEKKETPEYLRKLGIRYVIVPFDSMGELFQNDRKYDDSLYQDLVKQVGKLPWLQRIEGFGKIAVFQTRDYNSHFVLSSGEKIESTMITPYQYVAKISISQPQELIFAETFNSFWEMRSDSQEVKAKRDANGLNTFPLQKVGTYTITIYFSLQKYYILGGVISLCTLIAILSLLFVIRRETR